MKIFDTHAHYNDAKYDEDREKLLKKIYIEGVDKIVLIGASLDDSISEKSLYEKYKGEKDFPIFYYTVGDHPDEIIKESPESEMGVNHLEKLKKVSKEDDGKVKAIAIGEIGLDYYGESKTEKIYRHQKDWFIAEMRLAKELDLPIVVHSRDACMDTYDTIKEYANGLNGVIHCFSYEKEIAKKYIDMGFYIGIGGTVTFKNARKIKETVESIPIEYMVTETDCPWLAPTPHRGERNDSSYIKYVIEEIARIKNMDKEELAASLYNNALKMYKLI